ncbi:MAG: ATP-binding cassette domain-containing protein [Bacteroidales bacterium]|nr:ATP-binding cassette domain-containing protein [Bacteroidales bacterium]
MEKVLTIKDLNKNYGKIHAVKNLNLEIDKGCVFGILGPNGSGKTTTLGIILSVINAKSGSFSWFEEPNSKENRKRIGAILEQPIFYPYLSAVKNLKIVANIKEVSDSDIERVLKIVELYDRRDSKFKTYSYGMKQRLAIASALLGNPEVLIFDEPTNGLDPKGIAEIRELIIKIAKEGITIILASHLLDEVQKTCTHVAVLKSGEKLFSGKVSDVLNVSDSLEIASNNLELLSLALNEYKNVLDLKKEHNQLIIKLKEGTSAFNVNSYLVGKGIVVTHLAEKKKSLENQFLELLKERDD